MIIPDAQIQRLNPWWTSSDWEAQDVHLRALSELGVRLPDPPFVQDVALDRPAVHTIHGPRQVGKSTGLKRLALRAMEAGGRVPRSVIYLALDYLGDQPIATIAETIRRSRELAVVDGGALLLLDEVTAVRGWAEAIKALWDDGTLRRDVVVCTGSSALELASSSVERLPGRRGSGRDDLVLPQSFANFAAALNEELPPSPGLSLAQICEPSGRDLLRRSLVWLSHLDRALERYLCFGGLPAAVAEAIQGAHTPSFDVQRVLWDSLEREILGPGVGRAALVALLERVGRSLGSKTNWSRIAREMDIPLGGRRRKGDYRTVKESIERLSRSFSLMIVHFWKTGSNTADLSRDKKIYFGDPLLQSVILQQAPGLSVDVAAAVENAIALALYRRYEPSEETGGGFGAPTRLHVYESATPKEIDFVCGPRSSLEMLEVKYQSQVRREHTLTMRKAHPGRPGVLATKETLYFDDENVWVPASLLLWALS